MAPFVTVVDDGGYETAATDYDAVDDWSKRNGGIGAPDGKQGIFSGWLRLVGQGAFDSFYVMNSSNNRFEVLRDNSPQTLQIIGRNAGIALPILDLRSVTQPTNTGWIHLIASWNLAVPGSARLYVSDLENLDEQTYVDNTIEYSADEWTIGATITPGNNKWKGCLSEIFFHDVYLDIGIEANRRKFISGAGRPVNLGPTGAVPLGVQPRIYVPNGNGEVNAGTGGNFTNQAVLSPCATSPSD